MRSPSAFDVLHAKHPTCAVFKSHLVGDALARRQHAPVVTLALTTWHGLDPTQLPPDLLYNNL